MDQETQKQVFERLDAIASKLGVAAEHLWGVLVRQTYVEGVKAAIGLVVIVAFWTTFGRRGIKRIREEYKIPDTLDRDDFYEVVLPTVLGLVAVLTGFGAGFCVDAIVTATINPEWGALEKIKGFLK